MKSAREAEIGDTLHTKDRPVPALIDIQPAKVGQGSMKEMVKRGWKMYHCPHVAADGVRGRVPL